MEQNQIDNLLAAKMAVEQMFNKIQLEFHEAKTLIILKDNENVKLKKEIETLNTKIEGLNDEVSRLQPKPDLTPTE